MASSVEEVRSRMYEAFSKFGFFIFSNDELSVVSRILASLNLHRIVRVRTLGKGRPYMVAEVDYRSYEMLCRDECMKDHIMDEKCFLKCKESKELELIREILKKLEDVGGGGGTF